MGVGKGKLFASFCLVCFFFFFNLSIVILLTVVNSRVQCFML